MKHRTFRILGCTHMCKGKQANNDMKKSLAAFCDSPFFFITDSLRLRGINGIMLIEV